MAFYQTVLTGESKVIVSLSEKKKKVMEAVIVGAADCGMYPELELM
jgi:hypothetical protein